jgi:hypothetical protein
MSIPRIHIFLNFIGFKKKNLPFRIIKDNIIFQKRKHIRKVLPDFSECEKCAHG